jgi:hypothetical protein
MRELASLVKASFLVCVVFHIGSRQTATASDEGRLRQVRAEAHRLANAPVSDLFGALGKKRGT